MRGSELDRRGFLALGGFLPSLFFARTARGDFKRQIGGRISFRLPWLLRGVDPHRLDDLGAQIFGPALFDALYTIRGEPRAAVPALAATFPEVVDGGYELRLREGILSGGGKKISASDAAFSIERARSLSGTSFLSGFGPPGAKGPLTVRFGKPEKKATPELASTLARLLSSPLYAIVPSSFSAQAPDGTGPFRLEAKRDDLRFLRNPNAVLGISMLDEIQVTTASDLSASLRAFESGTDDLGWLGLGLYGARSGAARFDAGALADIVFLTGTKAPLWDVPGVPQEVVNGISATILRPFIADAAPAKGAELRWGAGPVDLFTREDPWLLELARAVAGSISKPGHTVTVKIWSDDERRARLRDRAFPLALDALRSIHDPRVAPGARAHALLSAFAPQRVRELADPFVPQDPRLITRTHRVGILAEAKIQGGVAPTLFFPTSTGVDWGLAARGAP